MLHGAFFVMGREQDASRLGAGLSPGRWRRDSGAPLDLQDVIPAQGGIQFCLGAAARRSIPAPNLVAGPIDIPGSTTVESNFVTR